MAIFFNLKFEDFTILTRVINPTENQRQFIDQVWCTIIQQRYLFCGIISISKGLSWKTIESNVRHCL